MKNILVSLSLVLFAGMGLVAVEGCGTAMAQQSPSREDMPNRLLQVSGTATVYAKPDMATVNLGCSRMAIKVSDAKKACDVAMQRVYQAVRNAGVSADDIQTTTYQIYAVPAQEKPKRPAQWKVTNQIEIKVRAVDTVSAVMDTAIRNGASNISNVSFGIEKIDELRARARELAVKAARSKAEQLAKLNGVTLGEVMTISDGTSEERPVTTLSNVSSDYPQLNGYTTQGLSSGKLAVDAQESISYSIR